MDTQPGVHLFLGENTFKGPHPWTFFSWKHIYQGFWNHLAEGCGWSTQYCEIRRNKGRRRDHSCCPELGKTNACRFGRWLLRVVALFTFILILTIAVTSFWALSLNTYLVEKGQKVRTLQESIARMQPRRRTAMWSGIAAWVVYVRMHPGPDRVGLALC